jgi:hypothetical protein
MTLINKVKLVAWVENIFTVFAVAVLSYVYREYMYLLIAMGICNLNFYKHYREAKQIAVYWGLGTFKWVFGN